MRNENIYLFRDIRLAVLFSSKPNCHVSSVNLGELEEENTVHTKPIASEWKWFSTKAGSFFPAENLHEYPQKLVTFVISQKRALSCA